MLKSNNFIVHQIGVPIPFNKTLLTVTGISKYEGKLVHVNILLVGEIFRIKWLAPEQPSPL